MEFSQSRTRVNLMNAFAGEGQARNRYTFFASEAKKAGYEQISAIYLDTAENEKEHAKLFYKLLIEFGGQQTIEVTGKYPVALGDTLSNLTSAIGGEHEEWDLDYPQAADIAKQEGFAKIASVFREVAEAEKGHELRFATLKQHLQEGRIFKREQKIKWRCRNCGRVIDANEAPHACPTCAHPQAYFEEMAGNY